MSHWIKIGPCLYNLDRARSIELDAMVPRSMADQPGVRILFDAQEWALFTGAEAAAVRMYLAALALERQITDLTCLVEPLPTADIGKDGGA